MFAQQKWGLVFEVLLAVMRVAGLIIGVVANDFMLAVACYSIATMIALLIQIVWMMAQVRQYDRTLEQA